MDIGCGSGLFSLAAHRLGAAKIVSVDVDDFSFACTKYLKKKRRIMIIGK
jgi:ribosomal protein L11 methylase PrmA